MIIYIYYIMYVLYFYFLIFRKIYFFKLLDRLSDFHEN